jgi:hypothetical protein
LTYLERQKSYGPDKLCREKAEAEEAEAEEKIRLTGHNIFVFRDRSMIFGMWVHDHKAVYHIP